MTINTTIARNKVLSKANFLSASTTELNYLITCFPNRKFDIIYINNTNQILSWKQTSSFRQM
jgi:hypothetical protein